MQYSLKKNFKGAKTKKMDRKKFFVDIKKLKKKKIYYVRMRSYKIIGKQIFYSQWSATKKIKVKK